VSDRAAEFRKRAEECLKRAEEAKDPIFRQEYESMARGWLALARNAERQEARDKEK
jgi:hypothetical protein